MTSTQSQTQPWNLPPEILGLILSNLGKQDLLNSRMVCRPWNDESLKVLRKSTFTQMLRDWRIRKYITFVKATQPEPHQCVIPFHLNFKIGLPSSFRDLSLNILTQIVQSLSQIFGPQCVSTLTLTNHDMVNTQERVKKVIEFLQLISPGLKTLDLTRFNSGINFLKDGNQVITFPCLEKLICNTSYCQPGREGPELAYISIIENSPMLEDLTLSHPCPLTSWPLNFNKLKSLSLATMCNLQTILDKILVSSGPPILRELSLKNDVPAGMTAGKTVVYNILENVSLTLKSLIIREHQPLVVGNAVAVPRDMIKFPRLPHLEHLGLEYNVGTKYRLNPEDMNFSQETFPCLKSLELPTGFTFTSSPVQSDEDEDVTIEFPNLVKLKLRVGSSRSESAGPEDLNRALEHLQKIFPSPSKMSLIKAGVKGHDCVKYFLDCILKSNWSKNIQEFEMIGFKQDYLGEVLSRLEFSPRIAVENCDGFLEESMKKEFRNAMKKMWMKSEETVLAPGSTLLTRANQSDPVKMIDVTTIKLELTEGSNYRATSQLSSTASIPNLIGFGKHFPQLHMLEVSQQLFHPKDKSLQEKHILEFKSKFPDVALIVT